MSGCYGRYFVDLRLNLDGQMWFIFTLNTNTKQAFKC